MEIINDNFQSVRPSRSSEVPTTLRPPAKSLPPFALIRVHSRLTFQVDIVCFPRTVSSSFPARAEIELPAEKQTETCHVHEHRKFCGPQKPPRSNRPFSGTTSPRLSRKKTPPETAGTTGYQPLKPGTQPERSRNDPETNAVRNRNEAGKCGTSKSWDPAPGSTL